jgi:hypothetical protein
LRIGAARLLQCATTETLGGIDYVRAWFADCHVGPMAQK